MILRLLAKLFPREEAVHDSYLAELAFNRAYWRRADARTGPMRHRFPRGGIPFHLRARRVRRAARHAH